MIRVVGWLDLKTNGNETHVQKCVQVMPFSSNPDLMKKEASQDFRLNLEGDSCPLAPLGHAAMMMHVNVAFVFLFTNSTSVLMNSSSGLQACMTGCV